MKNFGRVLKLSLKYRWSILASFACSLLIGVLWSGNIATLYPVMEVVFRGESFHQVTDRWVEDGETACAERLQDIQQLEARIAAGNAATKEDSEAKRRELTALRGDLAARQSSLQRSLAMQAWVKRYLPDDAFQNLCLVIAALFAGTVLKSLFLVVHVVLVARIRQMTLLDLRNECFRRSVGMDLAGFEQYRTSGLMSRFTFDMRILEDSVGALYGQAVREPFKMIACLIGAALISWQLLLLSLLVTPLGILMLRRLSRSMKRTSGQSMDVIAELYARLSETFDAVKVVKAYNMEEYEVGRFRKTGREFVRRCMRFASYLALFKPVSEVVGIAVVSSAVLLGAFLILNHQTHILGIQIASRPLDPGSLMVFFGMLAGIADPLRKFSDIYAAIIGGVAASERVYEVMDRAPKIVDPAEPREIARPHRVLQLDHVEFHYRENEPVLKDVSVKIPFGQSIALLGPNGCGKSTIVNLVLRFYDPVRGALRMDGVDFREFRVADLRSRIGLVTQDTLLFDDTILNNIRYGNPAASLEQVHEAARQAHAHEWIVGNFADGYETIVGAGGKLLSGGQRQRIALARAILNDPEILILDEATSQVDIESERLILDALQNFVRNRTAILISHRLSTLKLADRIIVIDRGEIIDCGSHSELYERCEVYKSLYREAA